MFRALFVSFCREVFAARFRKNPADSMGYEDLMANIPRALILQCPIPSHEFRSNEAPISSYAPHSIGTLASGPAPGSKYLKRIYYNSKFSATTGNLSPIFFRFLSSCNPPSLTRHSPPLPEPRAAMAGPPPAFRAAPFTRSGAVCTRKLEIRLRFKLSTEPVARRSYLTE